MAPHLRLVAYNPDQPASSDKKSVVLDVAQNQTLYVDGVMYVGTVCKMFSRYPVRKWTRKATDILSIIIDEEEE